LSKSIYVTGCDAAHFELASDLLASIRETCGASVTIGFVHVGAEPLPAAIASAADVIARVGDDIPAEQRRGYRLARLMVKTQIRDLFPGYDVYAWLDGDTWVQNRRGLDEIVHCAQFADICLHPEADPDYFNRQVPDPHSIGVYLSLFGRAEMERHARFTMVNAGVFAARANSPVWERWNRTLAEIHSAALDGEQAYFSDQIPLHRLISLGEVSAYPLRAVNNWLVFHAPPAINFGRKRLLTPTYPHDEINIIHLVAQSKDRRYGLGNTGRDVGFRYREIKALFRGEAPGALSPSTAAAG
jgi:hypothetical protein